MSCFIIGCRATKPGRDYVDFVEAVERLGEASPCLDFAWIVRCDETAAAIRERLRPHLDEGDELFVAELTGEAAWRSSSPGTGARIARLLSGERKAN